MFQFICLPVMVKNTALGMRASPHNRTRDTETAHVGISMFSTFSIICSSVTVRSAQCGSAQRNIR